MEFNSYASYSSHQFVEYGQEEEKRSIKGARPAFYSSLHAVAKPMKKPIAPLPPTKPKVYKVDPVNFKDVVQRLTAAPEFQRRRLEEMAPPALDLSATTALPLQHLSSTLISNSPKKLTHELADDDHQVIGAHVERKTQKLPEISCGALSPLGFSFSPSALAWPWTWTFSPLLSPGTLSSLEQSTVL